MSDIINLLNATQDYTFASQCENVTSAVCASSAMSITRMYEAFDLMSDKQITVVMSNKFEVDLCDELALDLLYDISCALSHLKVKKIMFMHSSTDLTEDQQTEIVTQNAVFVRFSRDNFMICYR
ncbi:MAG: hypothetical protein ACRDCE_07870 [Cetobacterium sp.]|uniref:hypothetical protein n=1 Tax=Cetobacterium sp. TaxID=2071632 RepID=UPI003EE5D101